MVHACSRVCQYCKASINASNGWSQYLMCSERTDGFFRGGAAIDWGKRHLAPHSPSTYVAPRFIYVSLVLRPEQQRGDRTGLALSSDRSELVHTYGPVRYVCSAAWRVSFLYSAVCVRLGGPGRRFLCGSPRYFVGFFMFWTKNPL